MEKEMEFTAAQGIAEMKKHLKGMKKASAKFMSSGICVRTYGDSTFTFSVTCLLGYGGQYHVYVKQSVNTEVGETIINHKIVAHHQTTEHCAINYAGKKLLGANWKRF